MGEVKKKKHRPGEIDAAYFDKLPQRCKEVFFDYLSHGLSIPLKGAALFADINGFEISEECKSPIEQLFDFVWQIMCFEKSGNDFPILEMQHQYKIIANGKTYYADFYFDSDFPEMEYREFVGENHLKLVIECDGHEFHEKTKEQVKKGNERDFNLKIDGYEILHFSGSQLFENPLKCANEVFCFIMSRVGSWKKVDVGE